MRIPLLRRSSVLLALAVSATVAIAADWGCNTPAEPGVGQTSTPQHDLITKVFSSKAMRIAFAYPADWDVLEAPTGVILVGQGLPKVVPPDYPQGDAIIISRQTDLILSEFVAASHATLDYFRIADREVARVFEPTSRMTFDQDHLFYFLDADPGYIMLSMNAGRENTPEVEVILRTLYFTRNE